MAEKEQKIPNRFDPTRYRPMKVLVDVAIVHELDRVVADGVGGYANRHELVNDLLEQGLIGLRYPEDTEGVPSDRNARASTGDALRRGESEHPSGSWSVDAEAAEIHFPSQQGTTLENELAIVREEPMFGMHNRDAPSAWALGRLAEAAHGGPVSLAAFYDGTTAAAWNLAAQLELLERPGQQKLAIMLPRNPDKPQSAAEGFRTFAMGQIARKPDASGRRVTSGPFFQWNAVGLVGDPRHPEIGLTEAGWELTRVFAGLAFELPHDSPLAWRFLDYLQEYAPADLWGFSTVLAGAAAEMERVEMNAHALARLNADFPATAWKASVADSIAAGYVSRGRAWGLLEPKLVRGAHRLTRVGADALERYGNPVERPKTPSAEPS
jgi:hypothetical protein